MVSATIERPENWQRHQESKEAKRVKTERIKLRSEIRRLPMAEGCALLADALMEMPEWLEGQDALKILEWPSRISSSRAGAIYTATGAWKLHRVGELSERQRKALAHRLRHIAGAVAHREGDES